MGDIKHSWGNMAKEKKKRGFWLFRKKEETVEAPKKTKEPDILRDIDIDKKHLSNVDPELRLWLSDGRVVKNLPELAEAIESMEDETYEYHVTKDSNDFSDWVKDIIKNPKLANQLKNANKSKAVELLGRSVAVVPVKNDLPMKLPPPPPVKKVKLPPLPKKPVVKKAIPKVKVPVVSMPRKTAPKKKKAFVKKKSPKSIPKVLVPVVGMPRKTKKIAAVKKVAVQKKPVPKEIKKVLKKMPVKKPQAKKIFKELKPKKSTTLEELVPKIVESAQNTPKNMTIDQREKDLARKERELAEDEKKLNDARIQLSKRRVALLKERGALERENFERFIEKTRTPMADVSMPLPEMPDSVEFEKSEKISELIDETREKVRRGDIGEARELLKKIASAISNAYNMDEKERKRLEYQAIELETDVKLAALE
ncbi:MAG: hypothetical protein GY861_09055 [bacterium]|nr:hypothetical protein [bacterium]